MRVFHWFILAAIMVGCGPPKLPCHSWDPMSFCGDDGEDRPTQLLIYSPKELLIEYTHGEIKEALELAKKYCGINNKFPHKQSDKPETFPGLKKGMKVAVYSCVDKPDKETGDSEDGNAKCNKKCSYCDSKKRAKII